MSKREKLLKWLHSKPADFNWCELETVMQMFGFQLKRTGGSWCNFARPEAAFAIHDPYVQRSEGISDPRGHLILEERGLIE
jgi:hypothetical protein